MLGSAGGAGAGQLGAWLPHTRAWLAGASGQLPQVEQLPALVASPEGSPDLEPDRQQALPQMRAGLRASGSSPAGSGAVAQLPLEAPVAPRSWQGLVRLGLVQLVSGEHEQPWHCLGLWLFSGRFPPHLGTALPACSLGCAYALPLRWPQAIQWLPFDSGVAHHTSLLAACSQPRVASPASLDTILPTCCAGEGAIGRLPLPELLRLDAPRLHAAQVGGRAGRDPSGQRSAACAA